MKYILITHDKLKFILDDENYEKFLEALAKNDKAFVIKKYKTVIPLHITPTVVPFEIWYTQENERLALTHHRLCKKCLSIMAIEDKCTCWREQGTGEEKNAFVGILPESVKERLGKITESKSFPKLDNWDKGQIEVEEAKRNKPRLGEGWYEDPETGERIYY